MYDTQFSFEICYKKTLVNKGVTSLTWSLTTLLPISTSEEEIRGQTCPVKPVVTVGFMT